MRLQLTIIAAMAWLAAPAQGQDANSNERNVEGGLRVYSDDDHVTVVTPSIGVSVPVAEAVVIDVGAVVDIISAASVDVITSASPGAVEERRIELGTGVTWNLSRTLTLASNGLFSHENDYDAFRLSAGGSLDVAQRNATIDLRYAFEYDIVGIRDDNSFSESRLGHELTGTFTQILDRKTYADFVVHGMILDGYHANPYRTVPVISADTPEVYGVSESTPEVRKSFALLLRVRRAFGASGHVFVNSYYRFYADDWDVKSHTLAARVIVPFANDRAMLGVHMRGYLQTAADFYQSEYIDDGGMGPVFRTRDRTLSGVRSLYGGLAGQVSWALASLGVARFYYQNFPAQRQRTALILSLGSKVSF